MDPPIDGTAPPSAQADGQTGLGSEWHGHGHEIGIGMIGIGMIGIGIGSPSRRLDGAGGAYDSHRALHPVLTTFELGDLSRPIGSYGVLVSTAILVIAIMVARAAARARLDWKSALAVVGFGAGGAFAGSYLLSALVELVQGGDLAAAFAQVTHTFYGALLGGTVAVAASARYLELPLRKLLDLAAPALPLGHALGRMGCFLGGCCFGRSSDLGWAVRFEHPLAPASFPAVARHPVQLYEAAGLLMIAAGLAMWRDVGTGRRFLAYLISYAMLRFGVEFVRADYARGVFFGGLLSTSQIIAVAVVLGSIFAWRLERRAVEAT